MKHINAKKKAETKMLQVTLDELVELTNLNPYISIGKFDLANTVHKEDGDTMVGYLAGDINKLQLDGKNKMITDSSVHDVWFVSKNFFNANYEEIKQEKLQDETLF